MFVTIKALTSLIDDNIYYIQDAKRHHNCSEEEYNQYLDKMYSKLDRQIEKLKSISCNTKLINTYIKKVEEIKND